jgi:hypothetical protein
MVLPDDESEKDFLYNFTISWLLNDTVSCLLTVGALHCLPSCRSGTSSSALLCVEGSLEAINEMHILV